jgi:hypothetical protein
VLVRAGKSAEVRAGAFADAGDEEAHGLLRLLGLGGRTLGDGRRRGEEQNCG